MICVIITTKDEHNTLSRAIDAIIKSITNTKTNQSFEICVVGPDKKTQEIVEKYENPEGEQAPYGAGKNDIHIRYIKDKGRGKPRALNSAFKFVKGEICIMTDGDVYIDNNGIKNILRRFTDEKVGAVTGRPVSINQRKNLFGYWAHFLTHAAHQMRLKSKTFPCSGYLYAIRNIINRIPENIFSEDAYITHIIRSRGYNVLYAPSAKVYVAYPNNLSDWLKQKIRSTGGYIQNIEMGIEKGPEGLRRHVGVNGVKKYKKSGLPRTRASTVRGRPRTRASTVRGLYKMRNFFQEARAGLILFITYPKTLKEFFWTILLYMARIFLWSMIVWKIKIKKQKFSVIWQRAESTKH